MRRNMLHVQISRAEYEVAWKRNDMLDKQLFRAPIEKVCQCLPLSDDLSL